jgi:hypothetical protein
VRGEQPHEGVSDAHQPDDAGPSQHPIGPPGRGWYALAALVVLVGVPLFLFVLVSGLAGFIGELRQVVVPGTAELALTETGEYTIFHERRSVVDGQVYDTGDTPAGLQVRVTGPSGASVALERSVANSRYSLGGRAGRSIFSMYRLTAGYADGRAEPRTVLAVGQGTAGQLLVPILLCVGIMLVTLGVAIPLVVVPFVRRRRHRLGLIRSEGQTCGRRRPGGRCPPDLPEPPDARPNLRQRGRRR